MKNIQAIVLLFLSNIISGFAQGISMIAIPWYFVNVVSRPSVFTYFYLLITFLTLFWGLYAGTIIDRYSRKKVFIYTNLVCGTIIASVSFYGYQIQEVPDYLVLLVFGLTIFNYNIHYPNLYAFVQEITEKKNYGKLNSYIEVQGQVTSMFAGAFAAILLSGVKSGDLSFAGIQINIPFTIDSWPIHKIFLMDALTYFAGIIIFVYIKYVPVLKEETHVGSLLSRLRGGINYLKSNPSIFIFGSLSYMLFAFTLVEIHVLLPAYVERFMNESADVYASAEIFYSVGALISGVLVYRLLSGYNEYLSIMLLMLFVSIPFLAMSYFNNLVLFFTANLVLGITNAGVRILRTTYLFSHIPNNLIGRAGSVFSSINIFVRMSLIFVFSLPFFIKEDNIKWGYFIGFLLIFCTAILLFYFYNKNKTNL